MEKSTEKFSRYTLGTLLSVVAINAFGGGYYGMAGAENVPTAWLENSPFDTYFIPGLILFSVVGGTCLWAAMAVFKRYQFARNAAFGCVLIIFGWLGVQVAIIGYVSWLQPAIAVMGVLIFILTCLLPNDILV